MYFPEITGRKGFKDRVDLQVTYPDEYITMGANRGLLRKQVDLVKDTVFEDRELYPEKYAGVDNMDEYIIKQVKNADAIRDNTHLPALRQDFNPYKWQHKSKVN